MVKLRGNLTDKMEANPGKVHFRRWKAMSIGSRISLVVLILIVMIAVFANILAPHNPLEIFTARQAPDAQFLFGTDDKGRDVLSRMMYGARYSLIIGRGPTAFALVCGSIIGAVAAVARKWVSEVIMRILDVIMSFPGIALAATFVLVFGNSVPSLIFAIGFLYIPQIARIVRANVVSEYNQDYVRAVVVSGARAPWILVKHVIRNCIAPVMVFTIVLVADAIVFEASLSFISAGIPEPTPTWGNILSDARGGVLAGRWWQAPFPGLGLTLVGADDAGAPPMPWLPRPRPRSRPMTPPSARTARPTSSWPTPRWHTPPRRRCSNSASASFRRLRRRAPTASRRAPTCRLFWK